MNKFILVCILYAFFNSVTYAARPMIIDTDVAVDDVIAILYLFNRPIDIVAISIAGTGETRCQAAEQTIRGLMALANKTIPVACGREIPLAGHHHFPKKYIQASESLMGSAKDLPKISGKSTINAVDLLIKTLNASPEPIDILEIGPLTNIAEAIEKNPAIIKKIHSLTIMGGAINIPGNVFTKSNKDQLIPEWNFYIDPAALNRVFASPIAITLVPLDATMDVPMDQAFFNQLATIKPKTRAAQFLYQLLTNNKNVFLNEDWYFWDPLAAVITQNQSIAFCQMMELKVSIKSGAIRKDPVGKNVNVCSKVNVALFQSHLIKTLFT